jgi:hypothetical protein
MAVGTSISVDFQIAIAPNPCKNGWDLEVQSVADFLRVRPHQTINEICDWTTLSRNQVAEVLKFLIKQEMLGKVGNKFYLID